MHPFFDLCASSAYRVRYRTEEFDRNLTKCKSSVPYRVRYRTEFGTFVRVHRTARGSKIRGGAGKRSLTTTTTPPWSLVKMAFFSTFPQVDV